MYFCQDGTRVGGEVNLFIKEIYNIHKIEIE